MSVLLKIVLFAASLLALECTAVFTTGDIDSSSDFDLTPGMKFLTISGADGSGDPAHARPCASVGPFAGGKFVYTRIDLERQGDAWVGRSIAAADGNLVFTLHSEGPSIGRHTVTGTATGQAVSVIGTPASAASGVRIVFDTVSTQTIDGGGATIGRFVNGNITGSATFVDSTGNAAKCDWVQWTMQPLSPG